LFAASIVALVVLTIDWATLGVPFPGFGTIVALMVMLFGILFCLLGIVSIYIGQIYEEVKGRPNFIVRTTVGLDDPLAQAHTTMERGSRLVGTDPITDRGAGRLPSGSGHVEAMPNVSTTPGNVGGLVAGTPPDNRI
jgi:hypothetical protein